MWEIRLGDETVNTELPEKPGTPVRAAGAAWKKLDERCQQTGHLHFGACFAGNSGHGEQMTAEAAGVIPRLLKESHHRRETFKLLLRLTEESDLRAKIEGAVAIEPRYTKLERARSLVQVASQVIKLPHSCEWLMQRLAQGAVLSSERKQAIAASYEARADCLQDRAGHLPAWAESEQAKGHSPGIR